MEFYMLYGINAYYVALKANHRSDYCYEVNRFRSHRDLLLCNQCEKRFSSGCVYACKNKRPQKKTEREIEQKRATERQKGRKITHNKLSAQNNSFYLFHITAEQKYTESHISSIRVLLCYCIQFNPNRYYTFIQRKSALQMSILFVCLFGVSVCVCVFLFASIHFEHKLFDDVYAVYSTWQRQRLTIV